jgi:hypothetical protein
MRLHSTLEGRAGAFRVRGAAWETNSLTFRGFLYVIPIRDVGDGRHRVVEAAGESVWKLLDALSEQVSSTAGAAVDPGRVQSGRKRSPPPQPEPRPGSGTPWPDRRRCGICPPGSGLLSALVPGSGRAAAARCAPPSWQRAEAAAMSPICDIALFGRRHCACGTPREAPPARVASAIGNSRPATRNWARTCFNRQGLIRLGFFPTGRAGERALRESDRTLPRKTMSRHEQQTPVHVIYPAALRPHAGSRTPKQQL